LFQCAGKEVLVNGQSHKKDAITPWELAKKKHFSKKPTSKLQNPTMPEPFMKAKNFRKIGRMNTPKFFFSRN